MNLLFRNALLCDGTGKSPVPGELAVSEGRIVLDIPPSLRKNCLTIDAKGKLLTPGFIDIHAHSDVTAIVSPLSPGKIAQGVTTEVSGNCGLSPFPVLSEEVREHLENLWANTGIRISWTDLNGYASAVDQARPAINHAALCGHNTLRASAGGYEKKILTSAEQNRMKEELAKALFQGAAGLSTGLLYTPGCFSSMEELTGLVSVLRGTGKIYATHLRSEGKRLLESVDEAIKIAVHADRKLQISHLKTAGRDNWHKLSDLLKKVEEAKQNGLSVFGDRYPYTRSMTSLSVILPPPYDEMTDRGIRQTLEGSEERQKELQHRLQNIPREWNDILLCSTGCRLFSDCRGLSLAEAAAVKGLSPEEACVRMMAESAENTMAAFHGLSDENLRTILDLPNICCGSDETSRPADGSLGWCHPRGYGSFPEFFRRVSQEQSVEEAIRKMTSLPAEILGLKDRGLLKEGYAADLVLLDPERYCAKADFRNPHQTAEGVAGVWVAGILAWDGSSVVGRAGKFLRVIP